MVTFGLPGTSPKVLRDEPGEEKPQGEFTKDSLGVIRDTSFSLRDNKGL